MSQREVLVTVVTNNHNYGWFLCNAIDSALNQTYHNVEVIVVNDGDKAAVENASRFPHFPRTATAGIDLTYAPVSKLLLETIT